MNRNLVLIVEDDPDIGHMLDIAVRSAGYRTLGAADGRTAAGIAAVAQPVGIVTDLRMPAMDGLELCRLIRRNPKLRDTAVILISAHCDPDDVAALLTAGVDEFVPKPLSPNHLVRQLDSLISRRLRQPTCVETSELSRRVERIRAHTESRRR